MPFVKGQKRPKGAGRKKGEPGKLARDVQSRLEELGCDPIAGLARIAKATEKSEPAVSAHCYKALANKIYPDRKAVEHAGVDGGPIQTHDSSIESLAARIDGIAVTIRARADSPVTH